MIGKDRRCQSYPSYLNYWSYLNYLSDQSDRSDRWYQRVNGRTDRASLQVATCLALTGTDAQIVRPYSWLDVGASLLVRFAESRIGGL